MTTPLRDLLRLSILLRPACLLLLIGLYCVPLVTKRIALAVLLLRSHFFGTKF
jgi:hypothetical protein